MKRDVILFGCDGSDEAKCSMELRLCGKLPSAQYP
jgi:hypothetical protein